MVRSADCRVVPGAAAAARSGPSVGLALSLGQLIGRAGLPRSRGRFARSEEAERRGDWRGRGRGSWVSTPEVRRLACQPRTVSLVLPLHWRGKIDSAESFPSSPVGRGLVLSTLPTAAISLRDSEGAPPPTVNKSYQGKSIS